MYVCRVCLAEDRPVYAPLFSVQGKLTVAKTIVYCTGLVIKRNDGLSQFVCSTCVEDFNKFAKLKELCIQSATILQTNLHRSDEKPLEESSTSGSISNEEDAEMTSESLDSTIVIEEIKLTQENNETKVITEQWVVEMHDPAEADYERLEALDDPDFMDPDDTPTEQPQQSASSPKSRKPRRRRKSLDLCSDQSLFICCSCPGKVYDSLQKLEAHRTDQHNKYRISESTIRPFECDVCFQRFLTEKHLTQHKKRPYKKRKFVCSSCGNAFLAISTLKKHEETCTTTELNYECNECGKRFMQSGSLRNHMKLHTSEKTHSCPICGKTFLKKFEVPIHMVTHTTEQPFPCDQCPARFKRMQALRNHQRHHSNPTPYKCDMCDEWFNSFSSRKYHRQKVHEGIEPFRCEQCGAAYGRKSRLDHHIRKAHPSGT
ncbi:zinc finger protein 37 homolog [Ochlerotatus camptorhynchus]|uniref:zinc finger protein 37 homolog n=1 Tax=Ochlerotatus camptorhynchus TaxID=644619 RepID=UPI0031E0F6AD